MENMLMQILIGVVAILGTTMIAMLWYYVKRRDKKQDELIETFHALDKNFTQLSGWMKDHERRLEKLEEE